MLKQIDGRWTLVSPRTQRPLAYYRGEGKPPDEWVLRQEQRTNYINYLNEATYQGNIGIIELIKFNKKASLKQKKMLQSHIQNKKHKEFRDLIQQVTGVELHKTVNEKQEFISRAGAGEEGSSQLANNYKKNTPGQKVQKFKRYINVEK